MKNYGTHSWQKLAAFSFLSFGLGVFGLFQSDPSADFPAPSDLVRAVGPLAWVEENEFGTRFGLEGVPLSFDYPSNAGGQGTVRRAFRNATGKSVSLEYSSQSYRPPDSAQTYHYVWSLTVEGKSVRTLQETVAEWEADSRIAPWLTAFFILGASFLAWYSRREYKAGQQAAQADRREDPTPG